MALLGNPAADAIKPEDLERLKIKLATGTRTVKLKDGTEKPITRKPASINRFLQDLKAVFCKAVDGGKLDRNSFNGVDLLTENNKRARELSPDEEFRLFQVLPVDPPALRPYFRFLLETGARAGEACDLTWRAILWADGVADLPETKAGEKQIPHVEQGGAGDPEGLPEERPSRLLLAGWSALHRGLHHTCPSEGRKAGRDSRSSAA
jgi:integrase